MGFLFPARGELDDQIYTQPSRWHVPHASLAAIKLSRYFTYSKTFNVAKDVEMLERLLRTHYYSS